MRVCVLAVVPLIFSATMAYGQQAWRYDESAQPYPKASIIDGEFEIGGFCRLDQAHFLARFPRSSLPKGHDGTEFQIRFRVDVPATENFDVSYVTRGWERDGDSASVWFRGPVADDWIDRMIGAQKDVFLQVNTAAEPSTFVTEHIFSAQGSTASLRAMLAGCEV